MAPRPRPQPQPRPATSRHSQHILQPVRIPVEEHALAKAARAGDQNAFAGLVRLHQRRAYLVARAIVTVHEDAEDAVQEGFLKAYQAIGRFDTLQGFGPWLNRIVANAALDIARRRKVRTTEELTEALKSPFRNPAEDAELKERLAVALAELPERARSVIVMHDVEGFTHAEIGEVLGIPGGTARSDLHHARLKLRGLLKDMRDDE